MVKMPSTIAAETPVRPSLFQPFRALGYITSDIPLCIQQRGKKYFLTSSVGSTFQIYDAEKMSLLFVGNERLTSDISCMASYKDQTLIASGSLVHVFERGRKTRVLQDDSPIGATAGAIHAMLIMGPLLLALTEENEFIIWDLSQSKFINKITLMKTFRATTMVHPSTYVNKILLGSQEGTMQLWNISTMKLIYQFKSLGAPITFLTQSPSIDVIGIGTSDGLISLHNIKADKELFRFHQEGSVTGITFRSDEGATSPVMATSSSLGDIALWDLQERRLVYKMKGAHDTSVHTCFFFVGMPILLTAGSDNAIKQWSFDNLDHVPRILRQRVGHHKPPSRIRYYGADGHHILSAGKDRSLFCFSVIRDAQHVELSQGSLAKKAKKWDTHIDTLKAPEILDFDAGLIRQKEWDNIVTCHREDSLARTWNFQRKAIGKYELKSTSGAEIRAVALSQCGNFVLLGDANGIIDKYNIQSGLHRGSTSSDASHSGPITAIRCNHLNSILCTSSTDCTIKFWDFKSLKCVETMKFDFPVTGLELLSESGLLVVACEDFVVRLVDIDTKKIVRKFRGHTGRITDMAFSQDGRWIVSGSTDCTIRTWDIPTGYCIDAFKTPEPATSLSFSPRGDFIATTHTQELGIFLWANRSMYSTFDMKPIKNLAENVELPSLAAQDDPMAQVSQDDIQDPKEVDAEMEEDQETLQDNLIRTSSFPKSKWQNLLHLDAIKKRNKPIEPPKAPERAPFFLSLLAAAGKENESTDAEADKKAKEKKVFSFDDEEDTETARFLAKGEVMNDDYSEWFAYMNSLSPSQVDFEIQTLGVRSQELFLKAVAYQLSQKQGIDLCLAYLSVFLKVHAEPLIQNHQSLLETVREKVKEIQNELEAPILSCLAILDYITMF